MIRATTLVAMVTIAVLMFPGAGLGGERRASQRTKTAIHSLRSLEADAAAKKLVATLPGTDRNVIITPDAERNRLVIQAPANQVRRLQRLLDKVDPFAFGFGIVY